MRRLPVSLPVSPPPPPTAPRSPQRYTLSPPGFVPHILHPPLSHTHCTTFLGLSGKGVSYVVLCDCLFSSGFGALMLYSYSVFVFSNFPLFCHMGRKHTHTHTVYPFCPQMWVLFFFSFFFCCSHKSLFVACVGSCVQPFSRIQIQECKCWVVRHTKILKFSTICQIVF